MVKSELSIPDIVHAIQANMIKWENMIGKAHMTGKVIVEINLSQGGVGDITVQLQTKEKLIV